MLDSNACLKLLDPSYSTECEESDKSMDAMDVLMAGETSSEVSEVDESASDTHQPQSKRAQ